MAIVVITTTIRNELKFLIGTESCFLRDLYPDVHELEYCTQEDVLHYYTSKCKTLSRIYGRRIQFDTPDVYTTYSRARFRVVGKNWRFGVVKGTRSSQDDTSLDTALREFSEEVMPWSDRTAFHDMNVKIHSRDLYHLHIEDPTELCRVVASRTTMYYGELFDIEFVSWEDIQIKWRRFNVVSKRALETIYASFCSRGSA